MVKFYVGEKIGSGGFGCVYECKNEDNLPFALKRCVEEEYYDRFAREVRMQAPLRHKNIVPVIAQNLDSNPPAFVMPLALYNLREYLDNSYGEEEIWIIREIAEGLKYAHENGIIHRDIKPENILFFNDDNGELYTAISDFGLGRFIIRDSPTLTESEDLLGTIGYMAPEQFVDPRTADKKTDIYALGKVFYEILTGEYPYSENIDYELIPNKFRYIIIKACQNEPDRRYNNVDEMISDLNLTRGGLLTTPSELIKNEINDMVEEDRFDEAKIEEISRLLIENLDDNIILTDILPNMPKPILKSLMHNHLSNMKPVIDAYDRSVSEDLPFSYCDTVARFYERIFNYTDNYQIKALIINRLPKLAYHHNRYYVRSVFARIICQIDDPSLILELKDVLGSNRKMTYWCSKSFDNGCLPPVIKKIIKESEEFSERG